MSVTRSDRRIVTFYSFKGGVGRSMAVANVAFRLADRHDLRVIVVDWDLEAPGLHRFFGISDEVAATKCGLLEYLLAWREAIEEDAEAPPDATAWLIPVTDRKPAHGSLSLLLAGQLDEGYADRLRGFDWRPFYRFNAGAAAIETLRNQLAGQADMVLIDSRTGVTDAGGVCTVQMPDGVVLMTAANEQSFAGIERVAQAIAAGEGERAGRERPKVWVAVGRAPYLDVPKYGEEWFDNYGSKFEAGYEAGLWAKSDHPLGLRSHRLPHVGRWGFGEQILEARVENDDPLAMAYGAMGDRLIQWAMGRDEQDRAQENRRERTLEELQRDVEEAEERDDLARLSGALFDLAIALNNAGELSSAAEMFQKTAGIELARGQRQDYAFTTLLLGNVRLKQRLLDEARKEFHRALAIFEKLDNAEGESFALRALGSSFEQDVGRDLDKAEGFYKRALEMNPENTNLVGSFAHFLENVRSDFDKAEEYYKRALNADPNHADNLANYAGMLLALGRWTDGFSVLDRALDVADMASARVECWFYALAHRASEERGEALTQLKRLIAGEGARSLGWDFSRNVERARSDGHPDAAWLALLADVISKKADPAVLDSWPAWAVA